MILRKLILIAAGLFIWIASNAQSDYVKTPCDSAISICPATFDYFIRQDVLERKYYKDAISRAAEVNVLTYKLSQADSLQISTSNILSVTNQEKELVQVSFDLLSNKYAKLERSNKGLKFGCITIGVTAIVTTGYILIKK
jgi:hypothetical protein